MNQHPITFFKGGNPMKPVQSKKTMPEKIETAAEVASIVLTTVVSAIQLFKIFRPKSETQGMPV